MFVDAFSCGSGRAPAAVNRQLGAVDVSGFVAGQEQYRTGDLNGRAGGGGSGQVRLKLRIGVHVRHAHGSADLGRKAAGDDAVGTDPVILVHVSRIAGERDDGRLAGAVYRAGAGLIGAFGGDMYDRSAAFLGLEGVDGLPGCVERSENIDLENGSQLFVTEIADGGHVIHDAGVVDQNVQSAEFSDGKIDHGLVDFPDRDVTGKYTDDAFFLFQTFRQCFEALFPSGYGDHFRSFFGKKSNDLLAHAAAGSGDDSNFSC